MKVFHVAHHSSISPPGNREADVIAKIQTISPQEPLAAASWGSYRIYLYGNQHSLKNN